MYGLGNLGIGEENDKSAINLAENEVRVFERNTSLQLWLKIIVNSTSRLKATY